MATATRLQRALEQFPFRSNLNEKELLERWPERD
jgi:hypothetical protein